jgi:hypothetical protein
MIDEVFEQQTQLSKPPIIAEFSDQQQTLLLQPPIIAELQDS